MRAADMFTAGAWLRVWAVWGERVTSGMFAAGLSMMEAVSATRAST